MNITKKDFIGTQLIGIIYCLFGVLSFITLFYSIKFINSDALGGFILILIGAVFLYGHKELHRGHVGLAFIFVAFILSIVVGITYFLFI